MNDHDLNWLAAQRPERSEGDREAHDRALLSLLRHTTSRPSDRRHRAGLSVAGVFRTRTFAAAAGTGLAALAAAVVLSSTGGVNPAARSHSSAGGLQAAVTVTHHATGSPLRRLADYVSTSAAPSGDATLVQRTTHTGGQNVTVYDLYADNGKYYFSQDESGLPAQVSSGHNLAGGLFAREVAAAELAATGNVQQGAQQMADAPDPSHAVSPTGPSSIEQTAKELAAKGQSTKGAAADAQATDYDNYVWENSQDAIIAGAGDPQVRGGVLKILATLPGVTVTQGTSGGQPTLVLAAGAPELGYGYTEQLTINADSGVPVQFVGGPPSGTPATTVDYKVARVTLSDVATGTVPSF